MTWFLLAACSTAPTSPPPPPNETTLRSAAGEYQRGPAAVVAYGSPCKVERVSLLGKPRKSLFTVDGACPTHCAFEDRMAVCVEGDAVVRHVYGGPDLTLLVEPWVPRTERLFIAPDGVPHALSIEDGHLRDRSVAVTGSEVVRDAPVGPDGIRAFPVEISPRSYDLDSLQNDCPSGQCLTFGDVPASVLDVYRSANPAVEPVATPIFPDQIVVAGRRGGVAAGPVWLCEDFLCSSHRVLSEAPRDYVLNPPWVLLRDPISGASEVIGLEEAPSKDLESTTWATFVPLDLQL